MRYLITGANGFVGKPLCAELLRQGNSVRAASRSSCTPVQDVEVMKIGSINRETDWSALLCGIDIIVHLAARVHVMKDTSSDPLAEFRNVNLHGTKNLARQAASAGVQRLVYVSSIKVNGEETPKYRSYTEQDAAAPQDPYAVSKWESELALQRISHQTGLEVVILRPPLVYGPEVKGNLIRLFNAIDKGIPLPLAGADNARSLIYVGNLVDALITCATHANAAGQTYLVSDGKAVSSAELVEKIAHALGRSSRCFYVPPALMRNTAALFGYSAQIGRLLGSLQVDDSKLRRELGWAPPYTLEQGLRATAGWYRNKV
jgi:nucleoside-diphosphate-sugar epimerase